jgi:WhiB family transcriptional regulator, redox-sensing transcriptional regulator
MRPVDELGWLPRAACRRLPQEMATEDDQHAVLLAKKTCADCPVTSRCFAYAERLTAMHGEGHPIGVWGGLTLQERRTLAGLGRPPGPCPQCGLICVPVSYATDRCQVCDPTTPLTYLDYREHILKLIGSGYTYEQVAARLRLSKAGVADACYRWHVKAVSKPRRGRRPVQECGTLAAKTRHARHGESWKNCACRHVPWKKGKAGTGPRTENAHQNVIR